MYIQRERGCPQTLKPAPTSNQLKQAMENKINNIKLGLK